MPRNTDSGVKTLKQDDTIDLWEAGEIVACANDLFYFIENYVKVQHPSLGSVLFKLHPYQHRMLSDLKDNLHTVILAPRQTGKSSVIIAYLLWLAIFFPDKIIGIASNNHSGAKELLSRFRYAYENLPNFLKPAVISYNKFDIEFDNGSKIMSSATTENTFRGKSISALYIDEMAFILPRIAEAFYASILPTLSAGSNQQMIITSTPNGSEGIFAEIWFGAEQGDNGFKACRVRNDEVPGRDESFKKKMMQKMSEDKYNQEFEAMFISSKGTLIKSSILEALRPKDPIKVVDDIHIFTDIAGKRIGLAVDVGTGVGQDYSVIQVFDLDTLEQVAEYRNNHLPITEFTKKILSTLKFLLDDEDAAEIYYTVENNSIGQGVVRLLENSNNPILERVEMVNESRKQLGMMTTIKTKMKGALKFKDLVESKKLKIYSRRLISELKFFVQSGSTFKAETGMTDDLVMGSIIFVNMLHELASYDETIYDVMTTVDGDDLAIDLEDGEDSGPMPFVC